MSSIEQMMSLLGTDPTATANAGGQGLLGGGSMSAVLSSQMPQVPAPPMVQPQTRMVDRLHDRLSGLLGSVKSSAPAGYEGLLSQDEIKSAQPGVMTSLLGRVFGLGSDVFTKQEYGKGLDRMLEMKQMASALADSRDKKAQEAKHAATREQVGAILGDTSMDPQTRFAALTKLLGVAYANGDMQSMGAISSAMQTAKPEAPTPKNPIVGSPAWQEAKRFEASLRPEPRDREPGLIAVQVPDGEGGMRTVLTPKVAGLEVPGPNTRTPAAIQKNIAGNSAQLSVIDDAVKELDAHPTAVGLKRGGADLPFIGGMADAVNQRIDPQGVSTRASIANIGSLVIKDRSGSAVTISESGRLRPFIPSVGDTPATIKTKLAKLRAAIETETRLLQQGGGAPMTSKGSGSESVPDYESWKKSKGHP